MSARRAAWLGRLPWVAGSSRPGAPQRRARPEAAQPLRRPRIDLYAKPGCHLCDEARVIVERVAVATGAAVVEHDILADPELQQRYGEFIPVVLIDGRQHAQWRVDEERLARALHDAARP